MENNKVEAYDPLGYLHPDDSIGHAERKVFEHVLLDFSGQCYSLMSPHLSSESFSVSVHKKAWSVIEKAAEKESEINISSIIHHIPKGLFSFFSGLDTRDGLHTFAWWKHYLQIVVEAKVSRDCSTFARKLEAIPSSKPFELLEQIKEEAQKLQMKSTINAGMETTETGFLKFFQVLEERCKAEHDFKAVPTGIQGLDEMFLGGLRGGEVVVIGARPSMGKTSIAMDMFLAPYLKAKKGSMFFSLEMSAQSLLERALSHQTGVPMDALITGDFSRIESKMHQIHRTIKELSSKNLLIDDNTEQTIETIEAAIMRQWKTNGKPANVIIDYMQLLTASKVSYSRENEVANMSRGLKKIAKRYDIPVIVLSQINRNCEKRDTGDPMLSDLRESGAIEQDADKVIFINRPFVLGKHDDPSFTKLIVAKNRNGKTGTIIAKFDGSRTRIY